LAEPVVNGDWYLAPYADGSVRGVRIDLPSLVQDVTEEMRRRGLLGAEAEVVSPAANMPLSRLSSLHLPVESPLWERERAEIDRHYGLKTALLAGSALLGLALFSLLFLAQLRKWRFVELKSDFVAAVSHELRTPLASIRLMAETLERKLSGTPGAKDYPQRIVREADGLSFLVENLLSFHRIDKGRWVPRRSRVRLEELVGALRTDLAHWSDRPVQLRADVGSVELDADAPLLRLLFSNLGRNACAYNTRTPVELDIRAEAGGRVLFRDNGVGIPERDWERAFGEFQRLRGSGPEVHGSGLGLALCRRIMALHGGTLRITQSSPEGTTFELTFPETAS
ncbi:MAG TPA: HAMP domain-containing sensor histidine kinase, partial [Aggregicoccus sp.]|nr:HAMP domain-containing sensor histidine kinase [Aggregicoccus sp.]